VPPAPFGVAVVGFGWMGQVHSRAYARLAHHYPGLPLAPELLVVADPEQDRLADAVARYGFGRGVTNWREVLADDRVRAVSVTAPNFLHREIGTAVAEVGKHLWIEKPVGVTADDARAVAAAAVATGVQTAVGFNYRNAPAVEQARALISAGELGRVTSARVWLLADYAAHPAGALSWRFTAAQGGPGVLGDLVSHGVDLARYLVGEITELVADTATVITERPRPSGVGSHYALAEGGELGPVENEDYVSCLVRFAGDALGMIEASRVSVGDQDNYGVEVRGTKGMVSWNFRRMGELVVAAGDSYLDQSARTVFVGPGAGDLAAFQPAAAVAMSYDDLKVVEAHRFLQSAADGVPHGATIADAVAAAEVVEAITVSARERRWVRF
jgi:predicted dehydrogenase